MGARARARVRRRRQRKPHLFITIFINEVLNSHVTRPPGTERTISTSSSIVIYPKINPKYTETDSWNATTSREHMFPSAWDMCGRIIATWLLRSQREIPFFPTPYSIEIRIENIEENDFHVIIGTERLCSLKHYRAIEADLWFLHNYLNDAN